MILSDTLRGMQLDAGSARLVAGDDWLQGRSVFGGLQVVVALAAMRTLVPELPLRTLQTTFIAPIPAGAVDARAHVLRTGKSATQVEARLIANGETLAIVIGVFGAPRASKIALAPRRPDIADSQPPQRMGAVAEQPVPSFTQHFDAQWIRGGLPFSAHPLPEGVVLLDFRDKGAFTEAHLIALADFIPPVALSMLDRPTPGASVTWMLELPGALPPDAGMAGWRVDTRMLAAADGYLNQSTLIWAPDGTLAAISNQSMVVFG